MSGKGFTLDYWIGFIGGTIENGRKLDSSELCDLLDCLIKLPRISEYATNGDVIKAMFPNVKTELHEEYNNVWATFPREDGCEEFCVFTDNWWNESYKGTDVREENNDQR